MWIIFGLGNPGSDYSATRHNVGFRVVENLARRWRLRLKRPLRDALRARIAAGSFAGTDVVLAQPTTYMNRVGQAAGRLLDRFDEQPERLLVVYDDADLELGRLRIRPGGGTGGHNGIRSLVDRLQTRDFPRLKLGVRGAGRAGELHDYVLGRFDADEVEAVERMLESAAGAVETVLTRDLPTAMNEFNPRAPLGGTPDPPE